MTWKDAEESKKEIEECTPNEGFNLCEIDDFSFTIDVKQWFETKEQAEKAQGSPEYKNKKTVIYGSQPATG